MTAKDYHLNTRISKMACYHAQPNSMPSNSSSS